MGKITVWECKYTGKLFKRYCDYRKHLKKLAKVRSAQRKKDAERKRLDAVAVNMRQTVKTFDELTNYILAHGDDFIARARHNSWRGNDKRAWENLKLTHFSLSEMSWRPNVSNSHSCPFGGVQNWCGTNDKLGYPKGYPGWSGQISGKLTFWWNISGSDILDGTGVNTGSGGGGENWSYDVKIFAVDFPAMTEQYLNSNSVGLESLAQFKKLHPEFLPDVIERCVFNHVWTIAEYRKYKDVFPDAAKAHWKVLNDAQKQKTWTLDEYNDLKELFPEVADEQAARLGWEILARPAKIKA